MRAGRASPRASLSVRPFLAGGPGAIGGVEEGMEAEEEEIEATSEEEIPEKVEAERDDEAMKKMIDPSLPSQEEVAMHCLMGHIPYRSWCPVCIKSQGRDLD